MSELLGASLDLAPRGLAVSGNSSRHGRARGRDDLWIDCLAR